MPNEPISLFSHRIDPAGLARLARRIADDVEVVGPSESWEKIIFNHRRGVLRKPATLTLVHDPLAYEGPRWSKELRLMGEHVGAFPDAPRKGQILNAIGRLRFGLTTRFEPDFKPEGDVRLNYLFEVARFLKALLFTPTSLRDWEGRVLIAADGWIDEDAQLPVALIQHGDWGHESDKDWPPAATPAEVEANAVEEPVTEAESVAVAEEALEPEADSDNEVDEQLESSPQAETRAEAEPVAVAEEAVAPEAASDAEAVEQPEQSPEAEPRAEAEHVVHLAEANPDTLDHQDLSHLNLEESADESERAEPDAEAADEPAIRVDGDIPEDEVAARTSPVEEAEIPEEEVAAHTQTPDEIAHDEDASAAEQSPPEEEADAPHFAPGEAEPAIIEPLDETLFAVPDEEADDNEGLDGEAEADVEPPPAERVARRALILAALAGRGLLEQEGPQDPDVEKQRQRLLRWAESLELGDEPEEHEWRLLQAEVGTLDPHTIAETLLRFESLAMLAWALGLFEMPAYDQSVDPGAVLPAVSFLNLDAARALIEKAELRPIEEINGMGLYVLALHWRLNEFAATSEEIDLVEAAASAWFGPFDAEYFELKDNDLTLEGYPLGEAPHHVFQSALDRARERHQAFNWLHGFALVYSETDTAT